MNLQTGYRARTLGSIAALSALVVGGALPYAHPNTVLAETPPSSVEPSQATKDRLRNIVEGILAAWDDHDVVCLGEDHGGKNDSDLRIALVEHPDFVRKVDVVMVECASVEHQDVLDRFALDGEDMPREKLSVVWRDANGAEVWESPIYEAFMRAVRKANLAVPKDERVRLLAGDDPKETNRGKFIRDAVSREILSKGLKGLAIYGSGHCQCRGMGFPGELEDQYPGRIWAAFGFLDVNEGRRAFGLGDEPALIPIAGTERANTPSGKMFFWRQGRNDEQTPLRYIANAIVYYGNIVDTKVPAASRTKE